MSRLANKPIAIPPKVDVSIDGAKVTVKGPKGELSRAFSPAVAIEKGEHGLTFSLKEKNRFTLPLLGTTLAHVRNMIQGVSEGYAKKLFIEGVGYKADVQGQKLTLSLGFSHPVILEVPAGLTAVAEKGSMTISGIDKELLGAFAAKVRSFREPEPYKGKGIRYETEVIRRKEGKKSS